MRGAVLAVCWLLSSSAVTVADGGDGIPARPEPLAPSIERVLERVTPSVVGLWSGDKLQYHCTGTIISSDGLIVSCAHMGPEVGDTLEVRLADGRRCEGKVLSKLTPDPESKRDLALVRLVGEGPWPAVEVGTAADLTERDQLLAIGFPSTGIVAEHDGEPRRLVRLGHRLTNIPTPADVLATSIRGFVGDSGGPLFDLGGRLVGTMSGDGMHGAHCFYMTAELLRREWEALAGDRPAPPLPDDERPVAVSAAEETAEAVRAVRDSVVEVRSDDRWSGVGVVVGRGLILTKASELGPDLTVVLRNDKPAFARLVATDPARDLALLRMPAPEETDSIKPVEWSEVDDLPAGTPVAAVTPPDFTPPAGVVCDPAREVPALQGSLAVNVKDTEGGVEVVQILEVLNQLWLRPPPLTLQAGDVITHVGGEPVPDREAYLERFRGAADGPPRLISGDLIEVTFRRDGTTSEVLTHLRPGYTVASQLIWPASYRYTGFPSAIACDFVARPEHCGAPVADADGRVVGLLVARTPFVESLMLPASEVKVSLEEMKQRASIEP